MSNSKEQFLKTEFFIFSWKAATEHNLVWNKNTTDKAKGNFRKNIKEFLEEKLSKVYGKRKVTEEEHIKNIADLQEKSIELGNRLNFGTCQKLLNMMCKYYWCAGYIKEPPHLPIDSINLKNAGIKGKDMVNWTEIEEPQVYINLINKIKEKTSGQSLAQWEVDNWNRRNYKSVSYEK